MRVGQKVQGPGKQRRSQTSQFIRPGVYIPVPPTGSGVLTEAWRRHAKGAGFSRPRVITAVK